MSGDEGRPVLALLYCHFGPIALAENQNKQHKNEKLEFKKENHIRKSFKKSKDVEILVQIVIIKFFEVVKTKLKPKKLDLRNHNLQKVT